MKRILIILAVLLSVGAQAQNEDVTAQSILYYKSCYERSKSHGLQEKSIGIDGEVYNFMSERDFAHENIMVSDKEELQKLADKISYESYGIKGKFGNIIDWKSMTKLFGNNRIQAEQAVMSYTQEGTFQLMCHGISDQSHNSLNKVYLDGKEVDADRAAEIILKEMEGYDIISKYTDRPMVVVIHACGVGGKSDASFASILSQRLAEKSSNIYVVAASAKVYPSSKTWPLYREYVLDDKGKAVNWNCFHGGKFITEGKKDFAETVAMLQMKYSK